MHEIVEREQQTEEDASWCVFLRHQSFQSLQSISTKYKLFLQQTLINVADWKGKKQIEQAQQNLTGYPATRKRPRELIIDPCESFDSNTLI